jgi:hypothetical protein
MGTSRSIHGAILGKEGHNRIQIMPIERLKELLQGFDGYGLLLGHPFPLLMLYSVWLHKVACCVMAQSGSAERCWFTK